MSMDFRLLLDLISLLAKEEMLTLKSYTRLTKLHSYRLTTIMSKRQGSGEVTKEKQTSLYNSKCFKQKLRGLRYACCIDKLATENKIANLLLMLIQQSWNISPRSPLWKHLNGHSYRIVMWIEMERNPKHSYLHSQLLLIYLGQKINYN